MLDVLIKYLFEAKKLSLPGIGVFELESQSANVDFGSSVISPPGWKINFSEAEKETLHTGVADDLHQWVSAHQNIPLRAAQQQLGNYVNALHVNLQKGELIDWAGFGVLKNEEGVTCFTPQQAAWAPMGNVAAKKVIRENVSHVTLVGDKETTIAQMREQLAFTNKKKGRGKLLVWVLVIASLVAAAWCLSQYGCNKNTL